MAAPHVLEDWSKEAIDKIEESARAIAGDGAEIAEALERVKDPMSHDGYRPRKEAERQTYRLQAIAALMQTVEGTKGCADGCTEAADVPNVSELRAMKKDELIELIRAS